MAVQQLQLPGNYGPGPNNLVDQSQWSQLANLGNIYREAQKQGSLADLGKFLASGSTDYRKAAGLAADTGDINATLKLVAMADAQRKEQLALQASQSFGAKLAGLTAPKAAAGADDEDAPVKPSAAPPPGSPATTATPFPAPLPAAAPQPAGPDFSGRFASAEPAGATVGALPPAAAPAIPSVYPPPPAAAAPTVPPPAAARPPVAPPVAAPKAPSLSMAEGPTAAHIPMILEALNNPYLPEPQKKIAEDLWKRAMDSMKPTEKIQTLQGLSDRPDLLAIEKDLRKSQAPTVNMLPGEREVDKAVGDIHANALKAAANSGTVKGTLDIAERAMSAPGFNSGSNSAAVLAAQRAGVALGLLDANTASPNELFQKMSNKVVTEAAGGGGGGLGSGISNADRDFIQQSVFSLQNTPEGNKKIINTMRMLEDRKVEAVKEMNKYAHDHGGRADIDLIPHMAQWADAHPLPLEKLYGKRTAENAPPAAPPISGTHRNIGFTVSP